MIQPKEYIKHNKLQLKVNIECLQKYDQNAAWRLHCGSVIDIGSGDGSFTSEVLTKYLPENYKSIMGCDKSKEMVKYANDNYKSERITFKVLDISEPVPKEYLNKFDQAFSFCAIFIYKEKREILRNVYNLLAPGGGCFLELVGKVPSFYESIRILSNTAKWKPWLYNLEHSISAYNDSVDPVGEIEQMMADVGFIDIKVSYTKIIYTYKDIEDFQASVKAVNILPIPEDHFKEYLDDLARVAKENGYINDNYEIECNVFVALGKKN